MSQYRKGNACYKIRAYCGSGYKLGLKEFEKAKHNAIERLKEEIADVEAITLEQFRAT